MSARVICGSIYFARHAVQRSSADANNAQTLSHSCVSADLLLNDKIKMSFTLWIGARPFDTHTLCLSAHAYRSANLRCASFGVCFRFVSAPNGTQMHTISNRLFLPSAIHCALSTMLMNAPPRCKLNYIQHYLCHTVRSHTLHACGFHFLLLLPPSFRDRCCANFATDT